MKNRIQRFETARVGRTSLHGDRRRAQFFLAAICSLVVLVARPWTASAQQEAIQRAESVVQPEAYVSIQPVPRDHSFQIAVVARISPGFHVNAHVPSEDYLIPTKVTAELPPGVVQVEATYPRGVMRKLQFSTTPLRVYEGSFTISMKLRTSATARLGSQKIPITVSYQACNEEACLPPTKVLATAQLTVADADTPTHPANADIFSSATSAKSPAGH